MFACQSRFWVWSTAGALVLMLAAGVAHACKYNVRDAGFVDFEPAPYRLLVMTNQTTSAEWCRQLRHVAAVALLDSNVELEFSPERPAETLMGTEEQGLSEAGTGEPAALGASVFLVHPDGSRLARSLPAELDQAAAWSLVEDVASSPLRQRLLESLVSHFAVILVAEGTEAAENDRVRAAATGAVERFRERMPRLPKPVKSAPLVLTVVPAAGEAEGNEDVANASKATATATDVDWWALSLDQGMGEGEEAQLVVLYGRGRRAGPVLRGVDITETAVLEVLTILGQDCECDLDRSWLRGPLLPLRWEEAQQTEVVRELGFDAENPMVKAEISRIVQRGPGVGAPRVRFDEEGGGFAELGYSEVSLGGDALDAGSLDDGTPLASVADAGETPPAEKMNAPASGVQAATAPPAQRPVANKMSWMIIALAAAVAIGVALVFLFSGRSD